MVCLFVRVPLLQGGTLFPFPQSKTEQQPKVQESSEVKAPPSAAPSPEPVPLSEVSKRLEASRRLLREVSERSEPAELAEVAKGPIANMWRDTQTLPRDNEAAGLPVADKIVSTWISSLAVEDGAIHLTFGNQANAALRRCE